MSKSMSDERLQEIKQKSSNALYENQFSDYGTDVAECIAEIDRLRAHSVSMLAFERQERHRIIAQVAELRESLRWLVKASEDNEGDWVHCDCAGTEHDDSCPWAKAKKLAEAP